MVRLLCLAEFKTKARERKRGRDREIVSVLLCLWGGGELVHTQLKSNQNLSFQSRAPTREDCTGGTKCSKYKLYRLCHR